MGGDPREEGRKRLVRLAARAGVVASALAVFAAGWVAVRSTDWREVVAVTVLAGIAGLLAQAFSRRARRE